MMKRRFIMLAVLLVLVSAVPASAETWRNYGSARADGAPSWTTVSGRANSTRDIQLGWYTFEDGGTLDVSWHHQCQTATSEILRADETQARTTAGAWTWLTIRDSDRLSDCDIYVFTRFERGPHRVKVRVQ